ncbi:sulfotransferase domain-containing protein [Paracoccus aerodenitrificans]|uniref:sulfotransferase domain-containing protein n=1 Tax=Paracoccus aerodenitrificans TaxID=3017781 RepID=UPI0022F129EC|nr:sulfotransferase domain-containing protein [Paracoccus aerodenitrificans]WBU63463.1 sulfotransferase [Paracoccus aerodenitrificans]
MTNSTPLPSFIIAGAAKSATTWLQQSLQQSRTIFMPDHEPHFFARNYQRGMEYYHAEFAEAPKDALRGEKSNSYLTMPAAAARIHRHIPEVRLIFQLRDPVARAYSDYAMLFRRGEVDDNIRRHLDPDRAANERFLNDGLYAEHLQRFYDLFSREQILVLRYEDISRDAVGQLDSMRQHLKLSEQFAPPISERVKDAKAKAVPRPMRRILTPLRPVLDPIRHTSAISRVRDLVAKPQYYPSFDPVLKAELADFYRPQIETLRILTGVDFQGWISAGSKRTESE